jgi:DNA-binding XRE family transcriptional regulator
MRPERRFAFSPFGSRHDAPLLTFDKHWIKHVVFKVKRFSQMSDEITITPEQSRGARAMLGWSREELAARCKVSQATLADFEAGKRSPYARTLVDVRKTLEDGGVIFIGANGEGPGVRLRKPKRTKSKR